MNIFYFFSFKLKIWDDNRFGSARISSKRDVKKYILRNCTIKNSDGRTLRINSSSLYCAFVLN